MFNGLGANLLDVILGNRLAKGRIWPSPPAPPIGGEEEMVKATEQDELKIEVLEGSTACAVTSECPAQTVDKGFDASKSERLFKLPVLPSSLVLDEFILAQKEDVGLADLFAVALPEENWATVDRGYVICDGLLVRKSMFSTDGLSEIWSQIVVPKKHQDRVLKTAHYGDGAGHLGVRKTFHQLLQFYYWPRMKREVAAFGRRGVKPVLLMCVWQRMSCIGLVLIAAFGFPI